MGDMLALMMQFRKAYDTSQNFQPLRSTIIFSDKFSNDKCFVLIIFRYDKNVKLDFFDMKMSYMNEIHFA